MKAVRVQRHLAVPHALGELNHGARRLHAIVEIVRPPDRPMAAVQGGQMRRGVGAALRDGDRLATERLAPIEGVRNVVEGHGGAP